MLFALPLHIFSKMIYWRLPSEREYLELFNLILDGGICPLTEIIGIGETLVRVNLK